MANVAKKKPVFLEFRSDKRFVVFTVAVAVFTVCLQPFFFFFSSSGNGVLAGV
jgi:hypothetical protein